MGHEIDYSSYGRGYSLGEVLGPRFVTLDSSIPGYCETPLKQLSSLDKRCMYIALAAFTILAISSLGFIIGAIAGSVLLIGATVVATTAIAYIALNLHKKRSINNQLQFRADCLEQTMQSTRVEKFTEKDMNDYQKHDLSYLKNAVQIDVQRGLKITYNGKVMADAEELATACNNDKLILYNATQAITVEPIGFAIKMAQEKIDRALVATGGGFKQEIEIAHNESEGVKQLVSRIGIYLCSAAQYHCWCPLTATVTLDFAEGTRTIELSPYLGSSGIRAIPTK